MRVRALIFNHLGCLLLGLEERLNEFSLPGGHIEEGEHPVDAMIREMREETAITNWLDMGYLGTINDQMVFKVVLPSVPQIPQPSQDPDREFVHLRWFSPDHLPENISEWSSDVLYHYLRDPLFRRIEAKVEAPETPAGIQAEKRGNKWFFWAHNNPKLPDFAGQVNLATKTARIDSFKSEKGLEKSWLTWYEQTAKQLGALRMVGERPEVEMQMWLDHGYKVTDRGPGLKPSIKKVLADAVEAGYIEVLINGEVVTKIPDDQIWETMPGLAQRRAKGDKIEFRQVMDDGTVKDFNLSTEPLPTNTN